MDPLLTGRLASPDDPSWIPPPVIDSLTVWLDDRIQSNNGAAVPVVVYLDPRAGAGARDSVMTFCHPLTEGEDFTIRDDLVTVTVRRAGGREEVYVYPVVDVYSPIGEREVLAATFRATFTFPGGETQVVRYVALAPDGRLLAKAIYIPDGEFEIFEGEYHSRLDHWYPVRRLERRNIYRLRLRAADEPLEAVVQEIASGSEPFPDAGANVTYLRGLGVGGCRRSTRIRSSHRPGFPAAGSGSPRPARPAPVFAGRRRLGVAVLPRRPAGRSPSRDLRPRDGQPRHV